MNDSRLDAGLRPGISTFPMKHQILTIRLSLQPVFRFCRQIYTQPGDTHERLDDAAPEPDKRILRSQDCCRRPAGTASGSTGAGQQHLLPVFRQRIQVSESS